MRKSISWEGFHIRLSLAVCIALLISLAIAGCGGGGGGSSSGGGGTGGTSSSNLAVIKGTVQDTAGNPVVGATVAIVGTSLSASSGTNGAFQVNNVPLTATAFQVSSPAVTQDYNVGIYNGATYNLGAVAGTSCDLPLPALQASSKGSTTLPSVIQLYPATGGAPPPPPLTSPVPAGCPNP